MTTKPTFNPALPYTFEDTEEDKRELRKALVEWCEITQAFSRAFRGKYPNDEFFSDRLRWSDEDCQFQWQDVHGWVFTNLSKYSKVTYTPPEAIKVIMSGERFVLDSTLKGKSFYFHNPTIVFADDERGEKSRYQIEYSVNNFIKEHPNWHTAKLAEEEKPEPTKVFKDWEELCQWENYAQHPNRFDLKIYNDNYETIIEIGPSKESLRFYREQIVMAFKLGAKVELVKV